MQNACREDEKFVTYIAVLLSGTHAITHVDEQGKGAGCSLPAGCCCFSAVLLIPSPGAMAPGPFAKMKVQRQNAEPSNNTQPSQARTNKRHEESEYDNFFFP